MVLGFRVLGFRVWGFRVIGEPMILTLRNLLVGVDTNSCVELRLLAKAARGTQMWMFFTML